MSDDILVGLLSCLCWDTRKPCLHQLAIDEIVRLRELNRDLSEQLDSRWGWPI